MPDHRVRPLEGRLARIFELEAEVCSEALLEEMCARFLAPMHARGRLYEDAIPALDQARAQGLRTAIVSNTPWGSPAKLWRAEVDRLGLSAHADVVVFCGEAGWRKPEPSRCSSEMRLDRMGKQNKASEGANLMTSKHLVDPDLLPIVEQAPPLVSWIRS